MRFLVDAQLPPALARWLTENKHEADHVLDVGLVHAEDNAIVAYAAQVGAVIVSKDEDFANRVLLRPDSPSVLWVRTGNCSTSTLIARFKGILPDIVKRFGEKERLIELV